MALLERLGEHASHHTIDWYYRDLSHLSDEERAVVNFDHPDSLEVDLFVRDLAALRAGQDIEAPVYDFSTHTRSAETFAVASRPVIVAEGIHLLALETVRAVDLAHPHDVAVLDMRVNFHTLGHRRRSAHQPVGVAMVHDADIGAAGFCAGGGFKGEWLHRHKAGCGG